MWKLKMFRICAMMLVTVAMLIAWGQTGNAANKTLHFQGKLTNTAGDLLTGDQYVTFKLYNAVSGGSMVGSAMSYTVSCSSGLFNIELGTSGELNNISFDAQYWLQVEIGGQVLTPRQAIGASGYALGSLADFNVSNNLSVVSGNLDIGGGAAAINSSSSYQLFNSNDRIEHIRGTNQSVLNLVSDQNSTGAKLGGIYFGRTYGQGDAWINLIGIRAVQNEYSAYNVSSADLTINTNFGEKMRITSGGKLGIGTTSPRAILDVINGTANTSGSAVSEMIVSGPKVNVTQTGNLFIQSNDEQGADKGGSIALGGRYATSSTEAASFATILGAKENGTSSNLNSYLAFGVRNTGGSVVERMRINSSGNVGLFCSDRGEFLRFNDRNIGPHAGISLWEDSTGAFFTIGANYYMDSSPALVRYNTSTPGWMILMNSFSADEYFDIKHITAGGSATTPMTILANGNVGIGNTSPGATLDVNGTINVSGTGMWHHSGAQVFSGTCPTSWTDLDLSSYVGANYALVLLRVTAGGDNIAFRANGDTNEYYYNPSYASTNRGWARAADGVQCMIMLETGSDGKVEWKTQAGTSSIVYLIGYIK